MALAQEIAQLNRDGIVYLLDPSTNGYRATNIVCVSMYGRAPVPVLALYENQEPKAFLDIDQRLAVRVLLLLGNWKKIDNPPKEEAQT